MSRIGTNGREEWIISQARSRSPAERATFLDGACAGDLGLRERLEALLAVPEEPDPLLTTQAPAGRATVKVEFPNGQPDEAVGQTLGRYRLLEKVGEGGCGVVYVAEQTEPVRRRVALKVIKLGMDTKAVVARFEAERQALAMMDHPNIARVLDAGTTETGRPFFVMELVRGIRITDYCDQANLTTKERLDLFIKVCQAIQHAHQKGIIHRDIKPSNILVTLHDGAPVPKVIDFGIAKATEGRLTDATVYTQLHQFIGTPAYMSPEQAEMSGLDIDTRSDIYSLGVLLYELLVGSTPFDAKELVASGLDTMRKTIREREPVRPSTRFATLKGEELTTTAKRRSADTSKLLHQLKGDLDWIVMKCLEKDRTRRYETANGLAADLKRHLNNEPVVARPPSRLYEFQKTARRHKFGFAAAAALIAVLAIGILTSTWQAARATRAKRDALQAQAQEALQRQKAEANEKKASEAQVSETKLRQQAEAAALIARQRAYASDMNVAKQALEANSLGRAQELLNRQRPGPGEKDLRGWEWRYLWQQCRSDARFTLCQKSEVNSLALSADARLLAIGMVHRDGLAVWDLETRQEVAHLALGENDLCAVFSPTEPLLAFSSSAASATEGEPVSFHLRLWNTATRQIVIQFPLEQPCPGLAFSQDGRTLVTSTSGPGGRGTTTLLRIPDGAKTASYPSGQNGQNTSTDFLISPDLSFAASGLPGGRVCLTDLRSGKELWNASAAKEFVTALALSPDHKTLATAAGFSESDIRLWDVVTGKETGRLEGHSGWVGALVFWPDGKRLASSSADQTIRIWDLGTRTCVDILRGHRNEVWRLVLLPDQRTLISGSKDGAVCVWDTSAPHPRRGYLLWKEQIAGWCFSPDSRSILTVNQQGEVARWSGVDFQAKEPLLQIPVDAIPAGTLREYLAFSGDGQFLARGSLDGGVSVFNVAQRALWREFKTAAGRVVPMAFFGQGNRLFGMRNTDNRLFEWDLVANREIQSWPAPRQDNSFGVSPDERLVVAAGWKGDFNFRDLPGRKSTTPRLDILEPYDVAFAPSGKLLVMGSLLGYARVWDTVTWQEVATLRGFRNACSSVAFSPDGNRIITGGGSEVEALKLWAVDSWQELFTLTTPGAGFRGVTFSPDGNALGVLSLGMLHVWQAPSWEEINAAEAKE